MSGLLGWQVRIYTPRYPPCITRSILVAMYEEEKHGRFVFNGSSYSTRLVHYTRVRDKLHTYISRGKGDTAHCAACNIPDVKMNANSPTKQ